MKNAVSHLFTERIVTFVTTLHQCASSLFFLFDINLYQHAHACDE